MEPIETLKLKDGRVLEIYQDDCPESPREFWDNLGTMVCWHRRYNLGDKQADPEEAAEMVKGAVCLPLYLYDHSGITMRCAPFSCPWDSGQVGWIFVSKERIRQEFGKCGKSEIEKAKEILRGEVETYDLYLTGDVYFFRLVKPATCATCGHTEPEVLDSCGGFYGHDWKANGLFDHAGIGESELDG
jgi:hypothetical protein